MMRPTPADARDRTVIFLHIPKAAGTTLRYLLMKNYEPEKRLKLSFRESVEDFKRLPEATRRTFRAVGGHMAFGLHQWLPQASTYVTMLRDPVDRVISHYYHVLRHPKHYLHAEVAKRNMSLKDYVCSGVSVELDNGQTRDVAGEGIIIQPFPQAGVPYGKCSTDMLERARRNLDEHFSVVGLAERFDESLLLLNKTFGWPHTFYIKGNVGGNRPAGVRQLVPPDTLRAVQRYNELDIQLYAYARTRLEEQLAQQGPWFRAALRLFQALNGAYQAAGTASCTWARIRKRARAKPP